MLKANSPQSWLSTVWDALHAYREDLIPEGEPRYDEEWSNITTAMAWITEALGRETGVPEEQSDSLLREALEFLNDRPAFGLRRDPHYTTYKLASKIDRHFRGEAVE